jgi:fructose-bisphosphate aldolase class II
VRFAGSERDRFTHRQLGAAGSQRGKGPHLRSVVAERLAVLRRQVLGQQRAASVHRWLDFRRSARAHDGRGIWRAGHLAHRSLCREVLTAGEAYFAKNGEPLFSSHMLDLSEEPLEHNLEICRKYLTRMAKLKMTLEIELGVTGGEEDGVDNSHVEHSKLYTSPADVLRAYDVLGPVGNFTVAASFGNTHGVYAPGNVKLKPSILRDSQDFVQKERKTGAKPLDFVFHGGSGSTPEEISEAVSYGVVKMNIDTDTQWAFTQPVKKFMDEKSAYLQSQLGNPEGPSKPNKKYIDPRGWIHLGEKGMTARLVEAMKDLGAFGKFDF